MKNKKPTDSEMLDWLGTRYWSFTRWPDRYDGRKRNLRNHIRRCMADEKPLMDGKSSEIKKVRIATLRLVCKAEAGRTR